MNRPVRGIVLEAGHGWLHCTLHGDFPANSMNCAVCDTEQILGAQYESDMQDEIESIDNYGC